MKKDDIFVKVSNGGGGNPIVKQIWYTWGKLILFIYQLSKFVNMHWTGPTACPMFEY